MIIPNTDPLATAAEYRYGFNGMEKDNELKGGDGKSYDYGFRMYDGRLGRFLSSDPLFKKFPYWSPYHFAGNTPIQAIDLDGLEILFVNGHYQDNAVGRHIFGSDKPGKEYWGEGFEQEAQKFFKDNTPVTSSNYINGSSIMGIDQSGEDRFTKGYNYAKNNLEKITKGYVKEKANFKMVTHSEGSAYGAGIAKALEENGWKVSTIVHLSADEGDEFTTPEKPHTIQFNYKGDWVTSNRRMKGTDEFYTLNREDLDWTTVHGTTKGKSVFKHLKDVMDGVKNAERNEEPSFKEKVKRLIDDITTPPSWLRNPPGW